MDRAARHIDLRTKGEFATDRRLAAGKFGEDATDTAGAEANRPGLASEKGSTDSRVCGIESRVGNRIVAREHVDTTIERNRGRTLECPVLTNVAPGESDIAARSVDDPALRHLANLGSAAGRGDGSDIDIEPAQTRITRRVRRDADLHAGREDGLTVGRRDAAGVVDRWTNEHDASTRLGIGRGAGDRRARLHGDVAVAADRGVRRVGCEARRALRPGRNREAREKELRVGIVEKPPLDEVCINGERGSHQRPHIHLTARSEDNAVAIDDIDLTRCLDRTEDLARGAGGIIDPVKSHPLRSVTPSRLIVTQRRLPPHIVGLPAQQSRLLGLTNIDRGATVRARLRRQIGPRPDRGAYADTGIDLKTTCTETVRHIGKIPGRIGVETRMVRCRRHRRETGRVLHGLHRLHRTSGACQIVPRSAAGLRCRRSRGLRGRSRPLRGRRRCRATPQDVTGLNRTAKKGEEESGHHREGTGKKGRSEER